MNQIVLHCIILHQKIFTGVFTWCTINGKKIPFSPLGVKYVMKAYIHHIFCSLRLFSYPENVGSCFSFLNCLFLLFNHSLPGCMAGTILEQSKTNAIRTLLLHSLCINSLFESLNVLFFFMITFLSYDISQNYPESFQ